MVRYGALKGLYELEKTIGCGGFAKVKLATHLATGEKVAIKIMEKARLGEDLPRVKLELKALKSLTHEHICKLYQVIETESHYFIVIEYCSGGELFDHIVDKNRLTEAESRMFFRQIVSAVAYLHSLGYVHRDLKPENVLLDKHQNLKLIDFGLCAKPEGGVKNLLFTSCGSPTYAAPELVLGKSYLGPEVDVWAMGVLLYALLAGALPFDDMNIDNLYKKILSGRYEEPRFMSRESCKLIKSMLQVDPKQRITVKDLLSHSWLTLGVLEPVQILSEQSKIYDKECIQVMANHYQVDPEVMWKYLKKWRYDYHTSTYFLLMSRKRRGSPIKLNNMQQKLPLKERDPNKTHQPTKDLLTPKGRISAQDYPKTPEILVTTPKKSEICKAETLTLDNINSSGQFLEPRRPTNTIRKPLKRIRSPTLDGDCSPVPAKKVTPNNATPGKATVDTSTPTRTPDQKHRNNLSSDTPGSARRVLGSIERSLHKVRHVLTPKKQLDGATTQPVSLTNKDLCNVSTTQCRDPEYVINELSKALETKGIVCNRKGYSIRGKFEPSQRFGGCSFELEICYLPILAPAASNNNQNFTPTKSILKKGTLTNQSNIKAFHEMPYVGIRRKRLKGDSWCYKRVCEQVLALTATDFKPNYTVTESSV